MVEILKANIQSAGIIDTVASLGVKHLVDGFAFPMVGNNNFLSGIVKLGIGGFAHGKGGRIGNIAANGLILDGADDIYIALMGMIKGGSGGTGATAQQDAW